MSEHTNMLGLAIGFPVPDWQSCEHPPLSEAEGRFCRLEPLDPDRHADDLYEANATDRDGRMWTYLPYGPFVTIEAYRDWMHLTCRGDDPLYHAIIDRGTGKALGIASFLRIEPAVGCIEVGHISYSPALQRTPVATEAMYLMMARVFDELGYRRYEWKCDALNAASRGAAERLGFTFEGVFRQATLYKGRNRDTAWFSVIDSEWPVLRSAFRVWLDAGNFDSAGNQRRSLGDLMVSARGAANT